MVAKGMVDYFYYDYVISWMELLHIVVSWVLMSWTIVPSWEEIMVLDIDSSYVMERESLRVKKRQPTNKKRDCRWDYSISQPREGYGANRADMNFEIVELKSCRIAIMLLHVLWWRSCWRAKKAVAASFVFEITVPGKNDFSRKIQIKSSQSQQSAVSSQQSAQHNDGRMKCTIY